MTIGRKIGLGFGCILCLGLVLAAVILFQMRDLSKQFGFVIEHDAPVIANARHLSGLIVDMETGQRGFVITGKEEFLEPYVDAKVSFAKLIAEEKKLVSDNPPQVRLLEQIEAAVAEWQERAAIPEIEIRRGIVEHGINAGYLQDMLLGETEKGILDQIRETTGAMREDFERDGNLRGVYLLKAFEKSIVDQETGQRGFLITGKENFLEPYIAGKKELGRVLTELRALVANAHDRAGTVDDVEELRRLQVRWMTDAAKPEIAMRRTILTGTGTGTGTGTLHAQIEETLTGSVGKSILDEIRVVIERMTTRFQVAQNESMRAYTLALGKSIVDQETGQRGFLLTGREEFLEPFYVGQEHWRLGLTALADLNSKAYGLVEMVRGIDRLESLASDWLTMAADPEIAARREMDKHPETLEDVAQRLEAGEGKRILDRIRGYVDSFIEEEHRLTAIRYDRVESTSTTTNITTISIALVSLLFGTFLAYRITRGITRPIGTLTEGLAAVAAGKKIGDIPRTSNDEIGDLAESFNKMVRDLGELEGTREKIQDDLQTAKEIADSANLAKSEFLANMSHEIRTPMTAILGFAEIVRENVTEPETVDAITTVRRNGEYLLGIINDILDLSKVEAGKTVVEQIPCSPCQIIAEVMSLVRVRAEGKNLACNVEYIGDIPKQIVSDPTRLRQILINLLGNAIEFTEEGGIRLIVRFVDGAETGGTAVSPHMQFDVLDTGLGMTDEQIAGLFQPFMQADTTMTRKFGGTGLGLTISKRFAELLGGDIVVVESEISVGTRFRATVETGPVDASEMLDDPKAATVIHDTAHDAAATLSGALEGLSILVAEDGPDNQRLIRHLLKKAGAKVIIVENGKLAVDAALAAREEGQPFDVILMDMQMPVMDGYTAAGRLRKEGYTGPIVALTAHAMDGDREKCIRAGCDEFATKPIDRIKLYDVLSRISQGRRLAA